ncbi:hypothetical protein ACOMHN_038269 [Nucella lapillus]
MKNLLIVTTICLLFVTAAWALGESMGGTVDGDLGSTMEASRTDDKTLAREEEAINLDGLNVAQMKELRDKAKKYAFQAEVNRMMKLIINSLYKNKEIFLRELISNSSDALDKIRFLSLTNKEALNATDELSIKIKADTENHILHVTDTGIGMTKDELVKQLGTIAKSGTSDFLAKLGDASPSEMNDLIGQFGVGFYSSFLVADRVVVTSKSNDGDQYIWESDSDDFTVIKDPRGNTLGRGTTVSLHLKEEAHDFLETDALMGLVRKYSQFINFNIYVWASKTIEEEVKEEGEEPAETGSGEGGEKDGAVEEEEEKEKKTITKTVWDWELINAIKPIWTRKPSEVDNEAYTDFFKSISKETETPLAKIHFTAEGEVTFKSILFVPKKLPENMFNAEGRRVNMIKMYVRRVFITDNFEEMMPKYLSFIKGVVDSDDLPLNVSRETLQQNKLLKVIKKKLVRKTLDMIKKIGKEEYRNFWKEYGTNIKLGVMEDTSNRTRLAKLLKFYSSYSETEQTTLEDYVERMKDKQDVIYFVAGNSRADAAKSPFVERLLKKGFEVLFLTEAVDEYCVQALPEFDGKKFQNVAKEGLQLDRSEKAQEYKAGLQVEFEPLLKWFKDVSLKDMIERASITERLSSSPCALVASQYGWSGNMERLQRAQTHAKIEDASQEYYSTQKKTLEINPRHPLIKALRNRVEVDPEDETAKDLAMVMFEMAVMRGGYILPDSAAFADRMDRMLRLSMDIPQDEQDDDNDCAAFADRMDRMLRLSMDIPQDEQHGHSPGRTGNDEDDDNDDDDDDDDNNSAAFADRMDRMLRLSMDIPQDEQMEDEPVFEEEEEGEGGGEEGAGEEGEEGEAGGETEGGVREEGGETVPTDGSSDTIVETEDTSPSSSPLEGEASREEL